MYNSCMAENQRKIRIIEYKIGEEEIGLRLSKFLKEKKYPEGTLAHLRHEEGTTLLNNKTVYMNHVFEKGDEGVLTVRIRDEEKSEKIEPVELALDVVYEDEDLHKPCMQGNWILCIPLPER